MFVPSLDVEVLSPDASTWKAHYFVLYVKRCSPDVAGHMRSHNKEISSRCKHPGCGESFTSAGDREHHEQLHASASSTRHSPEPGMSAQSAPTPNKSEWE
jgi:hypothetical protein